MGRNPIEPMSSNITTPHRHPGIECASRGCASAEHGQALPQTMSFSSNAGESLHGGLR